MFKSITDTSYLQNSNFLKVLFLSSPLHLSQKEASKQKITFQKEGGTFVIRRIHRSQLNTHQNDWTLTGFIFLLSIFIKLSENEGSVRCWGSFCKDHYNFVFYANATSAFYLNVMGKNYDSSSFVLEQQKDSS